MVTTRKQEELTQKRKEIETQKWGMRRQDSDSSSESDGDCVTMAHGKKRRKCASTVHPPSDQSRKKFQIVPPTPLSSDRSKKSAKALHVRSDGNQEIVPPKGRAKRRVLYPPIDRFNTGVDSVADQRLEANSAAAEEEDEEGGQEIIPVSAEGGQEIIPPEGGGSDKMRADRMKMFREKQAELYRLNPQATRPPHPPYNKSFLTDKNRVRYDSFLKKGLVDERSVDLGSFASLGVEQILKDNHILSTVTSVEPYVLEVVMEFYANLPPSKEEEELVFVRGKMFEFSPKLISAVLELPPRRRVFTRAKETSIDVDLNLVAETLTGGKIKDWNKITPAYLTPPVAALHVMCCANWIPTSNTCTLSLDRAKFLYMLVKQTPFDFGKLAYDQILRMGRMVDSKFMSGFPALIYQVLSYQRDIPLHKGESLKHLAKPICNHIRLSRGKHVSLPSPSGRKRKHASLPSPSSQNRDHASHPLPSGRKAKLRAYVDKAMAYLHTVNDCLLADDDDDDVGTE